MADEQFNWDTIKFVDFPNNSETLSTPDGMVFFADGGGAGGKLKYSGRVYVDLNGADGPTITTVNNGINLINLANNAANFDVIFFDVTRDGTVQVTNAKARQYLEMN